MGWDLGRGLSLVCLCFSCRFLSVAKCLTGDSAGALDALKGEPHRLVEELLIIL